MAASVDERFMDENGCIMWDKLKPAHYCRHEYKTKFVGAYQTVQIDMIYKGPIGPKN
jgi:hypothetical protein